VVSVDAALADAAATLTGNLVRTAEDVEPTLERVRRIPGVLGVLIIKDRRVGLVGEFPELARVQDSRFLDKITGHFRRPDMGAPGVPGAGQSAEGAQGAQGAEGPQDAPDVPGEPREGGDLLEPRGGFRLPG
jgi:hypothetical protein